MTESMPIYLRAHTVIGHDNRRWIANRNNPERRPQYALVFDCETRLDTSQALILCSYQICCRGVDNTYICVEEGLVFADEASAGERLAIREYAQSHKSVAEGGSKILVLSRSKFIEKVFYKLAYDADALVCGFNLPFDLTRLAVGARKARRNTAWSLIMSQYKDAKTGRLLENRFRSRIIITPKDSKAAFITFAGRREGRRKQGRFLDLRTLAWALRNESYSLDGACKAFHVPGKLDHTPSGRVTSEEIDYCRQDVRASVALLNAELAEFISHPIDLLPERAMSSASIGKSYLSSMGVVPPSRKFRLPPYFLGIAMQAYFGGRAECRIRRTSVPVALVDFTSQYPTVNTLLGLWDVLTAATLWIDPATYSIRELLERTTLADTFRPEFWKQLNWFALVRPRGDVLPVRTTYTPEVYNIGLNHLTSEKPIWFTGPDVVASMLHTGKVPEIVHAFRLAPGGKQEGLTPIAFRGETYIDPREMDFFKAVIEARGLAKRKKMDALAYALKILANATSYGLFVEVNPIRATRENKVQVFSGEDQFTCSAEIVEPKGLWHFPPIGALVTGGGRLLLAMLERTVADAGGTYLFADTDSMGIVAKEKRAIAPCVGGPLRSKDGKEAVKALSFDDVRRIVKKFDTLNPYDRKLVPHILKIERMQPGLNGYAISTKRYVLYSRKIDGVKIEKASEHGLGYLYPPKSEFNEQADAPDWVVELWEYILHEAEFLPAKIPSWFDEPAMMRLTVTTPQVLKPLLRLQRRIPFSKRTKPYNFVLCPILNRFLLAALEKPMTLITPFTNDPEKLRRQEWVNIHDGKIYSKLPVPVDTFGDIAEEFCIHRENKSRAPDGSPCDFHTRGLLKRTQIECTGIVTHGKETDRQWEQGEDISLLFPLLPVYRPNETAQMVSDPLVPNKSRTMSVRALARKTGLSTTTVQAAREGKRLRKSTILKLDKALSEPDDLNDHTSSDVA